jgi:hypothetical protein
MISGIIQTEEQVPLPYANITVPGTVLGTMSDLQGYFQLEVVATDSVTLIVHYIGFKSREITILIIEAASAPVRISLMTAPITFSPIEVIGEAALERAQLIEPSLRIYRGEQMSTIPSIGGPDVFRALQALPGIQSSSELSNQLYIRGGTPDQNLVLINGVPVYQPFHLFGLTSAVDAMAVDYVKYYSGGFSARYGDRLSGVLDIVTKPGTDTLAAKIDWSLLSLGATMSWKLGSRWRWRITSRRTYFDHLADVAEEEFPYWYRDMELKVSYLPAPQSLITLNVYLSNDEYRQESQQPWYNRYYEHHPDPNVARADSNTYFRAERNAIDWGNRLASVRWILRHSVSAHSELTGYISDLAQGVDNFKAYVPHELASKLTRELVDEENWYPGWQRGTQATSRLTDAGVDFIHERQLNSMITLSGGGGLSQRKLDYRWNAHEFEIISPYVNVFMDCPPDTLDYERSLTTGYGFLETVVQPRSSLLLRTGLRVTRHSAYERWQLSPRINLTWNPVRNLSLKAGWGHFSQALSSSVEYGFYSIASLYFLSSGDTPPSAQHYTIGLVYDNRRSLRFDITGYLKDFDHLLYMDEGSTSRSGNGYSQGVEVLAMMRFGRFSTQLAYTLATTVKRMAGDTYYPNYDQRHKVNLSVSLPYGKDEQFSLNWTLSTGRPANLYKALFYFETWDDPYMLRMPMNFLRYPDFHRLDVKFCRERRVLGGILETYLQVINLYARKNVVYYEDVEDYDKKMVNPNPPPKNIWERRYRITSFNGFPFLPMIGASYAF